jgi:nucleoside-diphosphate-sugar epimerase
LRDATALVTGASGFIGRHLVARLERDGARVHATTRGNARAAAAGGGASLGADERAGSTTWHRLDLADAGAIDALVASVRPDFVFHLAGLVKGSRDRALVMPALEANLAATVRLLDAAAAHGCRRFLQVGSLEEPPIDQAASAPASPYAAAKTAATAYSRMYAELYAVPVAIARVFMVYGPGPQDDNKLVPYVTRALLAGETPKLSSGTREVDWIFVEDVVEGLLRLATRDGVVGRVVDLGTGELATVADVVRKLYRLAGRDDDPPFGTLGDRALEQVRRADVAATAAVLGWRPSVGLDEGLRRTFEWFRQRRDSTVQTRASNLP